MQLTINSFRQLFPDKIFSMTFPRLLVKSQTFPWQLSNSLTLPGVPDKWLPCLLSCRFMVPDFWYGFSALILNSGKCVLGISWQTRCSCTSRCDIVYHPSATVNCSVKILNTNKPRTEQTKESRAYNSNVKCCLVSLKTHKQASVHKWGCMPQRGRTVKQISSRSDENDPSLILNGKSSEGCVRTDARGKTVWGYIPAIFAVP